MQNSLVLKQLNEFNLVSVICILCRIAFVAKASRLTPNEMVPHPVGGGTHSPATVVSADPFVSTESFRTGPYDSKLGPMNDAVPPAIVVVV